MIGANKIKKLISDQDNFKTKMLLMAFNFTVVIFYVNVEITY